MRYPKQQLSQYLNAMQRGSAAVEMALLLPILILMIDGVLEFGLILHNESVLSSASSVAARAGIAKGSPKLEPIEIAQIAIECKKSQHLKHLKRRSSIKQYCNRY